MVIFWPFCVIVIVLVEVPPSPAQTPLACVTVIVKFQDPFKSGGVLADDVGVVVAAAVLVVVVVAVVIGVEATAVVVDEICAVVIWVVVDVTKVEGEVVKVVDCGVVAELAVLLGLVVVSAVEPPLFPLASIITTTAIMATTANAPVANTHRGKMAGHSS